MVASHGQTQFEKTEHECLTEEVMKPHLRRTSNLGRAHQGLMLGRCRPYA
jgi:hypothetical protein